MAQIKLLHSTWKQSTSSMPEIEAVFNAEQKKPVQVLSSHRLLDVEGNFFGKRAFARSTINGLQLRLDKNVSKTPPERILCV